MRKFTLLFMAIIFSLIASAQIKTHSRLQREDVDFKSIDDNDYFFYKFVTTAPLSPMKEIDKKYVLQNFSWNEILKTNYDASIQLGTILHDSLSMREPFQNENQNFIYLTASIPNNLIPLMMVTKYSGEIVQKDNRYIVSNVGNLYNLDLNFIPNLIDSKGNPIWLGKICEVITSRDIEADVVNFTIALELANKAFTDIDKGKIEIMINGFEGAEKTVIRKSDVGNKIVFCYSICDVLAFEHGILHLRYTKTENKLKNQLRNDFKYIGNIDGNKFHIKSAYQMLLYPIYVKYRDKPGLSLGQFGKYMNSTKKSKLDLLDMEYEVLAYNFGYEMDSLNIYSTNKMLPMNLKETISVKKSGDNYLFSTFNKQKNLEENNFTMGDVERVKSFFRRNVRYPEEAMNRNIQGVVRFKFTINPSGVISNIVILSSPDESLSNEVRRIGARKLDFKLQVTENIEGSMQLVFRL